MRICAYHLLLKNTEADEAEESAFSDCTSSVFLEPAAVAC
jgi:hypothetical protein